ncbi:fimbrial protein [Pantoea stewartii]|uniref:fimbrial protein n=1 Tax=Pantoea stewartii TaxID=66269 RepID=UPI000792E219|nr:fimbrial protein [Pantoea stewartii]KTS25532.1 fimbrial protein [Pantoea stewartii]
MNKRLLIIAIGALLTLTATDVQAYECHRLEPSTLLTPGSIRVPTELPIGSLIGSELVSNIVKTFQCSDSSDDSRIEYQELGVKAEGTYVATYDGRRVYSTNVPGLGYAVGMNTTPYLGTCQTPVYVDGRETMGADDTRRACAANGIITRIPIEAQARVMFYKTALSVGTGYVRSRVVGSFLMRINKSAFVFPNTGIYVAGFNVTNSACTVRNSAISVPMGKVEKRAFNGPGTWPGDGNTRSFSIQLNCNANTRVVLQLDGNVHNAVEGVLNVNGGNGSASGVGVQLLYKNAPLMLSTPISTGTTSTEGAYNIPLQARYYQTGNDITPGTANASATFTLTYQ